MDASQERLANFGSFIARRQAAGPGLGDDAEFERVLLLVAGERDPELDRGQLLRFPSRTTAPDPNQPMPRVTSGTTYVVEGYHPTVPGRRISVHLTRAGADTRAAELINELLTDPSCGGIQAEPATPATWRQVSDELRVRFGADWSGVEISEAVLAA